MPFSQIPIALAAAGHVEATQVIERGHIHAAMLIQEGLFIRSNHVFAQIWLMSMDTPTPQPIHLLASGYIDNYSAIAWDGDFTLDPSHAITGRIWCPQAVLCRLSFNVEID